MGDFWVHIQRVNIGNMLQMVYVFSCEQKLNENFLRKDFLQYTSGDISSFKDNVILTI